MPKEKAGEGRLPMSQNATDLRKKNPRLYVSYLVGRESRQCIECRKRDMKQSTSRPKLERVDGNLINTGDLGTK